MYESLIRTANARVQNQITVAITRATEFLKDHVRYALGGKGLLGLDCSGLVTQCFPRVLPDGVEKQVEALGIWVFRAEDICLAEPGDLVFLASKHRTDTVSHVAVVERVSFSPNNTYLLHASEKESQMTRDVWNRDGDEFKGEYIVTGLGKMQPFLFRAFLRDEIKRGLSNVG